jgi:Neuraminidase (sialidase)
MARIGIDVAYSSTPSVTRLPDGRLRMAWFTAPDHYGYGVSRTMTALSADDGATWSPAAELVGMRNTRDLCLSTAADGRVWMTYFLANATYPALGVYARASTDGGTTFGPIVRVDPNLPYAASTAPIRDDGAGTLWLPYYGRATGETQDSVYLATSTDNGATWSSTRIVNGPALGTSFNEPWLTQPTPGAPLQIFHRYGGWSQIGLTESTTNGATWTSPRPLFSGTGRAAAIETNNGLLVIYRNIQSRRAEYAISQDGGQTWPHQGIPMLNNANNSQYGMVYAAPLENGAGNIYCPIAMEDSQSRCALWQGTFTP